MTLDVQTDRALVRAAGGSVRHVLIAFTAPDSVNAAARLPVNVALVIDRSGSMGGSKIELARKAVVQALQMVRSGDRFSVVCYDHEVDVLVPSTIASPEAVRNAVERVAGLQARGNTDLGAGWLRGCEQIAAHLTGSETGRCLLLSDGLANQGLTDRDELARHADALRQRGVSTSTIGVGADFDERLLEGMAIAGAGHFYFVETAVQIPDILTSELGETLEVVARQVVVRGRAAPGIDIDTLNRFAVHRDADCVAVRLGDLTARQDVAVVMRLKFPAGPEGVRTVASFDVTSGDGALTLPAADVAWTFADHAANDAQPRNVVVDRAVAALYAAQARAESLELNRSGRYVDAMNRIRETADRIAQYAGRDIELCALVDELKAKSELSAAPMTAMASKAEHFASSNISRMRSSEGKAKRQ
jgi:Ca-activated chloride channel family protein